MDSFSPIENAAPAVGLVLRLPGDRPQFCRVTHLFEDALYLMWLQDPERANFARRPFPRTFHEIDRLCAKGAMWGKVPLPKYFTCTPEAGSPHDVVAVMWEQMAPLIEVLSSEPNLSPNNFSRLIRSYSASKGLVFSTVYRSVLRYYYFGGVRVALLPLPRGPKLGYRPYSSRADSDRRAARRGRQALLSADFGANDYILSDEDINQIFERARQMLTAGSSFITHIYERYMSKDFAERHPEIYKEYLAKRRTVPVTLRQFRYHLRFADLDARLVDNLARASRPGDHSGSLYASGPGEIYEIDSTGGRINLVSQLAPHAVLGTPIIYLMIDRWSRFIPSIYMSLRPASFEEIRHALLVGFTSRDRFRKLGVDVDEQRWPIGRMPAALCCDRGPENISTAMLQTAVENLRIDLTVMPPYCPDAKAIIESTIGKLKTAMVNSRLKGIYPKRPIDPPAKRAQRASIAAAVETLADAYRVLIEEVIKHNNREHSALKQRKILVQAGIPPVPQAAYMWGLKNISGLQCPPLTDADYQRLLLSPDTASLQKGRLRYRKHLYDPADDAAYTLCSGSGSRARQISIRVDKPSPYELFCPDTQGRWARFEISRKGQSELSSLQADEEIVLESQGALMWDSATDNSLRDRLTEASSRASKSKKQDKRLSLSGTELRQIRNKETADLKSILTGKSQLATQSEEVNPPSGDSWKQREIDAQDKALEIIRRHRRHE